MADDEAIIEPWTIERAIAFARDLVNSDNERFRKMGRMILALKDENMIRACEMVEQILSARVADRTSSPKAE